MSLEKDPDHLGPALAVFKSAQKKKKEETEKKKRRESVNWRTKRRSNPFEDSQSVDDGRPDRPFLPAVLAGEAQEGLECFPSRVQGD